MNIRDYEYDYADWRIILKEKFLQAFGEAIVECVLARVGNDPMKLLEVIFKFIGKKGTEDKAQLLAVQTEEASKRLMYVLVKVMEEVLGKES